MKKVIRLAHTFDFFGVNKTKLKFTAKSRNKKDEVFGNLTDIKIDLKNISKRHIAHLYVMFERECHNKNRFNEDRAIFQALRDFIKKSEHIHMRPKTK